MITPYLRDILNNYKTKGEWKVHSGNEVIDCKIQWAWKIQSTMIISVISSKYSDEFCTMNTKRNNLESMMGNETDELIEELF